MKIVDFKGSASPSNKDLPAISLKNGDGALIGGKPSFDRQGVTNFEKIK